MNTSSPDKAFSVILPTYNEAGNIVQLVRKIQAAVPDHMECEILVVDDNSPDGTYELVRESFRDVSCVVPILRTSDRGFAKSIRHGIERASNDRIIVMDSDLTHDPIEIPRLLHVGQIYDVVSGSRFCAGGRMTDTKHYLTSLVYNWVLRLLLRTQVQDNLGGYFTARREQILRLPVDEIFFGYGEYYFRLLHFVQRAGLSIVEVPSHYLLRGAGTSKSNWARMIWSYTSAALRLKSRIAMTESGKEEDVPSSTPHSS